MDVSGLFIVQTRAWCRRDRRLVQVMHAALMLTVVERISWFVATYQILNNDDLILILDGAYGLRVDDDVDGFAHLNMTLHDGRSQTEGQ